MGIEAFPEIENFNKLPRQVIVKGGSSTFDVEKGAALHGIVINNVGSTICELRVSVVVFNETKIPILNESVTPDRQVLPQGQISAFSFHFKNLNKEVSDYHLYTTWKFYENE